MFSPINIERLLLDAEAAQAREHKEKELHKSQELRGGNSGIVTDDGEVLGACHRTTLLRLMGIDSPLDDRSASFFSSGRACEERWKELLTKSSTSASAATRSTWSGAFLREREAATRWEATTPSGSAVPVTGSPDFVLIEPGPDYKAPIYDTEGNVTKAASGYTPTLLLELKKVCSSYRAVKVFLAHMPDAKHLAQLAHYSWQHGMVPGLLSYTSDSSYDTPYYAIKKYNAERKIQPGRSHYYTAWDADGFFCYIHPATAQVVRTQITAVGIERFYTLVLGMKELEDLGPRPSDKGLYEGHDEMNACTYCHFKSACTQYDKDHDYNNWVDTARALSKEEPE